ncbi:hypothetical protein [Vibrio europaeus]|uniref:hypothetical protein n=1 Tax=Vibrio europaeus TaxID=300876 RepID=UPI00233E67DF|nr:hypothetical protein [Vibrio europaeus]MDC5753571.1 hypothetical protein [Vibrio europaeus]MDC5816516.1 hypothetical protein [Vibrio europaeus]
MSSKEGHIESRIQQRNESNPSLAEQLMIEAGGSLSDLGHDDSAGDTEEAEKSGEKKAALPVCWACNGEGVVKGLFGSSECFSCEGTGFDLADPIAIIKQQNEWLSWSRKTIIRQRRQLAKHERPDGRTSEQKEADAVEEFYKSSKTNKHD